MADISKIKLGATTYTLKDADARTQISNLQSSVSGGVKYIGETSTALTDGSTTSTLSAKTSGSLSKTTGFVAGDLVIYGELEFIWNGTSWHEFGSTGSLKALAFKDSASGSVTPQGSISTGTGTANYTPGGTNSSSSVTLSGGSSSKLSTTSITPAGSAVTLHDTPTLVKSAIGSASSWNPGTMFSASYADETLTLTAGSAPSLTVTSTQVGTSLTAGTERSVATVGSAVTVATGQVDSSASGATVVTASPTSGTAAAQTFTGKGAQLVFSGSASTVTVK